ncbi:MAG: ClpP/crotonase-like domain-containing protein [Monoraphidium minutum]|nr:MAG: ClpP/crotonase-like domain-containing protein [Monoraphidium minutum]
MSALAAAGSTASAAAAAGAARAMLLRHLGAHGRGSAAWQHPWARAYSSAAQTSNQLQVTVEPLGGPHEGISLLTLDRPAARNALGRQLVRELLEALDTLRQERSTRAVLLRSAVPGCFSAGADLKERASMTQREAAECVAGLRRVMAEVARLPMPTLAVLEGYALGGGAELALAADVRVASASAALAFPEARLGIIPGAGGTQRLPRLVGLPAAKELVFTARRVGGAEAAAMGLVDHCVEEGRAMERALEIASEIAQCAPLSLRMAKAAMDTGSQVDLASGLAVEEACYAQLLPTRDRLEGLKAFAEKRKPRYTGE